MNKGTILLAACIIAFGSAACDKKPQAEMPAAIPASAPSETAAAKPSPQPPAEEAKSTSIEQRIKMLELAVAPKSPDEAIRKWAEAVRQRNGALEYALLDPAGRSERLKEFEAMDWVTGVSSPWLECYRIGKGAEQDDGSIRYPVQFDYRTSVDIYNKIEWKDIQPFDVVVRPVEQFWYIADH